MNEDYPVFDLCHLFPTIEKSSLIYIQNLLNFVNSVMSLNQIFKARRSLAGVCLGSGKDLIRKCLSIFCL